jgi:hypothetical protein
VPICASHSDEFRHSSEHLAPIDLMRAAIARRIRVGWRAFGQELATAWSNPALATYDDGMWLAASTVPLTAPQSASDVGPPESSAASASRREENGADCG